MVLIYTTEDECIEVPAAVAVRRMGSSLVCEDEHGNIVRSFALSDIKLYTTNDETARKVGDEGCEDDL
jgi:hypothetical protein